MGLSTKWRVFTVVALGLLVVAACSKDATASSFERSFEFSNHPDDEVLHLRTISSQLMDPMPEIRLYGDCRLERTWVAEGRSKERAPEAAHIYLSDKECTELVRQVTDAGLVDFDFDREQRRRRRYSSPDYGEIFYRVSLTSYEGPSGTKTEPFSVFGGVRPDVLRKNRERLQSTMSTDEVGELLAITEAVLDLWKQLDKRVDATDGS